MTGSTTTEPPPSPSTQRIVILGGGFAGVTTAQELTRRLHSQGRLAGRRRAGVPREGSAAHPPTSVTLINQDNYFVFQPLLADIISGAIETTHVVVPLRRMLPGADVEVGHVESIDPVAREVHVRRRLGGASFTVGYDALVVALGSVTDFGAVPGMTEYALGVRSLGDAFYLRNHALSMLEEAAHEADPERQRALLTFVVVGGGSTGVEVAAELVDLLHTARRTFASLPEPKVVLVHSRALVLSEFGERLGRHATKKLAGAGVKLILKRRLARVEADRVELDDGTIITTATVVSTVGNAPHPVVARLGPVCGRARMDPPGCDVRRPGPRTRLGSGRLRVHHRSPYRPAHAGDRAARRARRPARRAEHPGRPGRRQAAPVRLRPAGHAGVARPVQGRWRSARDQGLRSHRLVALADLLPSPSAQSRSAAASGARLGAGAVPAHDIVEISMRRSRTMPGEEIGEVSGEPVSVGARTEASDELVL